MRGQAPDLGSIANFVLFTSGGAVGNTAISHLNGDVGTHVGAITGFGLPTVVNGSIESANAVTLQAKSDLEAAYQQLFNTVPTNTTHTPAFGLGETLLPGVYAIAAAGSLGGTLILNAQGDPNAVFIFKFGGAFNTGAVSSVQLINGAQASHVFWIAEGEIAMAAATSMQGTMIANNGAISLGANGIMVGRMLSTLGAVSIYGSRISLTPFPFLNPGEAPNLGKTANFAIFTSGGAIDNTGVSIINGDIGTEVGAVTGFELPTVVTGSIEIANAATAQATIDLDAAYVELYFTPPTSTAHAAVFGLGETLTPGVYSIAAAGSVNGTLILDGQGNPDAVFIFKFGGALTTGAGTNVTLINSASACNIFWVSEGATSMAATTTMKGTLIANNGAISMGAGGNLQGRMMSTIGAASVYADVINAMDCSSLLPIQSVSFTANCERQHVVLNWTTATETNNDFFSVERSEEGIHWELVGVKQSNGDATVRNTYTLMDPQAQSQILYYRLKQTDLDGKFKYGNPISVRNCGNRPLEMMVYPNPGNGLFELKYTGNADQAQVIEIFNSQGRKVYSMPGFQSKFDLTHLPAGIYFMNVSLDAKSTNLKFVKH